ncbi:hypothetical protein ACG92U_02805 [Leuconostoc citreum]
MIYRNIHGSLKDKNIIFGIDASDNENGQGFDPYLVKFTKTSRILKLTNNSISNIKEDWNSQYVDQITIYGHSLGKLIIHIFNLYLIVLTYIRVSRN